MEPSMSYKKTYNGIGINIVIFSIFTILNLTPYLSRITNININIILIILWIFTAFLSDYTYFIKINRVRLITYIWISYLILHQLIGFADRNIGNLFHYLVFWFSIIVFDFYSSRLNSSQIISLVKMVLVVMSINIFSNIYELIENPALSKMITGSVLSYELGVKSNVGTYSYVLLSNIIMMAFITLFFNTKSKAKKTLFIFISLCSFYMGILASSMIGIISGAIMLIVFLFKRITKNKSSKKILLSLSVIIILLIAITFAENIYNYFVNIVINLDNGYLRERSLNILNAIFRSTEDVSFSGRETLYKDSINTFFNNFLVGIGRRHSGVEGVISLHSQILDDAAYFGIIGIIIQAIILYYFYKAHLHPYITKSAVLQSFVFSVISGTIFFALFNPIISISSGLILFIIMPLFCKSIVIE